MTNKETIERIARKLYDYDFKDCEEWEKDWWDREPGSYKRFYRTKVKMIIRELNR